LWRGSTRWVTYMYTYQWRVRTTRVAFIISDASCREESLIFPCISDASRKTRHFPYLWRVLFTRVTNTAIHLWRTWVIRIRVIIFQWRVSFARFTDILLLVTRIVPRAWAITNQWRVSFTRVTNILIVTRFFSESLIKASLISFSGVALWRLYLALTSLDVALAVICGQVCGFHYGTCCRTLPTVVGYTRCRTRGCATRPAACAYPFAIPSSYVPKRRPDRPSPRPTPTSGWTAWSARTAYRMIKRHVKLNQ
jgi:hypothetical protein